MAVGYSSCRSRGTRVNGVKCIPMQQMHSSTTSPAVTSYNGIGHKYCPKTPGTKTVYSGITVGFITQTGSTTFQCIPHNSAYVKYQNDSKFNKTSFTPHFVHTTKYETFIPKKNGEGVACAKCAIEGRDTIELLPTTYECQQNWTHCLPTHTHTHTHRFPRALL